MKRLILWASAVAMIAAPTFAQQSRNCAPRDAVAELLAGTYNEGVHVIGLAADNSVVEFWGYAESGTWTLTVTTPQGLTCLIASGKAFDTLTPAVVIEGDPT